MIITLTSYKGGVGKTTSAVHIAGCLHDTDATVLVDGDANRSALAWAARGSLPFPVADEAEAAKVARKFEHIVIDTPARPDGQKLKGYVKGSDMLILVTSPDMLALDAVIPAIRDLRELKADFRLLLTMCRPHTSDEETARAALAGLGVPVLKTAVRSYIAARKAALDGVLVGTLNDSHAADLANDYEQITKEILK